MEKYGAVTEAQYAILYTLFCPPNPSYFAVTAEKVVKEKIFKKFFNLMLKLEIHIIGSEYSVLYFVHLTHKLPLILQNNDKSYSRPFVGNECSNVCTVDCLHPDEYEYGLPIYLLLPTLQPPTLPTTYFLLEPLQL